MSVTQAQLAKKLGLSPIAVSYALRGSSKISVKTRERVRKAAAAMGYRPNSVARATRIGRFGSLALLLSRGMYTSHMPPHLLSGIDEAVRSANLHLIVTRLPDERLTSEGYVPKILAEQAADGLLINYTHRIPSELEQLIRRFRLPAVWLNSKHASDCVYPDDFDASYRATQHVLKLGHKRIMYLDDSVAESGLAEAHYSTIDREAGYCQAMKESGLAPRVIRSRTPFRNEQMLPLIEGWITKRDRPTAVLTYSPKSVSTLCVALALHGLRAPQDMSIITFRELPTDYFGFPSAAMILPNTLVGRTAVEQLCQKVEVGASTPATAVPFQFIDPEACLPPK